jgi:MFS family permease
MCKNSFLSSKNLVPAIANIVLVTNAFVWYFLIIGLLDSAVQIVKPNQTLTVIIWSLHFGSIAISAVVGAFLSKKIKNRMRFLLCWMIIGSILSILSIGINLQTPASILGFSVLFGISLGFGMPSCMGYFAETISVGKRGRIGGLIFLLSGILIVVLGLLGETANIKEVILASWRLFGLFTFILLFKTWKFRDFASKSETTPNAQLLGRRPFLLYFIPWLMFSLITNLTVPMQTNMIQNMQANGIQIPSSQQLMAIENIFVAVFALVGGFLVDNIGRKKISIFGFTMIGLGYASLGVFASNPLSWYFYTVVDGIALGIFYTIFVMTIWADFGTGRSSEKYYAIGVLPFFISNFLRFTVGFDLSLAIPKEAIFSFVTFFLFLAVLPLANAPETLPEKTMKDRELKSYLEKAQKLVQRENNKKAEEEPEKIETKERGNENSKDYNEAKKLAEKYY